MSVVSALDPTKGESLLEKLGPLLVVLIWLTMTVAVFFGFEVGPEGTAVYGVISGLAGVYLRHHMDE